MSEAKKGKFAIHCGSSTKWRGSRIKSLRRMKGFMKTSFVRSSLVISGALVGSVKFAVEVLDDLFVVVCDVALDDGVLGAVGRVFCEDVLAVVEETILDSTVRLEITGGVILCTNRAADHIASLGRAAKIGVS